MRLEPLQSYTGYRCDATDCEARIDGEPRSIFDDHYIDLAISSGWTFWAGRVQRHYCPEHGPRRGHRMSPVTSPGRHR